MSMCNAAVSLQGLALRTLSQQAAVTIQRRCLQTTALCAKNIRAGSYKVTINKNKPLTYEMANPPYLIGVRKGWNSLNPDNLHEERSRSAQTAVEDSFIRKFMHGTWHNLFLSELIIKRRANMVIIAGLVVRTISARKMYFLLGYSEELLSYILKCPVKMEIQTVEERRDVVFKYI